MSIKECLLDAIDCAAGIRDDLGLQLAEVSIITRKWTGSRVGEGKFTDTEIKLKPSPEIVDFSHDIRAGQGSYKSGDLILKTIPQSRFTEQDLRTDTGERTVEKFIKVGDHFYRTIHIRKRIVTWDIHVRKISEDETERRR